MAEMSSQQVDDLIYEIKRLVTSLAQQKNGTQGLKETADALGKTDRSIDKLILALGKVTTRLDGTARTRAEEEKVMRRFSADVERATKAQEKQNEQIQKNIEAAQSEAAERKRQQEEAREAARVARMSAEEREEYERKRIDDLYRAQTEAERESRDKRNRSLVDQIRAQRENISSSREVFEQLGSNTNLLKGKIFDLAGTSVGGQVALQGLAAAVSGVTKGMTSMAAALHKGERGASVSADALTKLGEPLLDFASKVGNLISILSYFVPGGLIAKGAVFLGGQLLNLGSKAAGAALELNKLAAQQVDALFKSFRELSTVGAAGARGLDDVFDTLQLLGMSVSEIEQFNTTITQNSQKLGMFGATAASGAREFAKVAGGLYKSRLGEELEMLGYTAAEQRDAALNYMYLQSRMGRLEVKSTDELIRQSAKFAKELDLAAQLTGQTRKDQMAAREAALAEVRFRAAMVQAQQSGDTERLARLQAAQQAAAIAKAFGDERGFTGILQYAAGGMTTPEAVAAEMTYRVSQILAKPNMSQIEMAQLMGENVRLQQQQLAGSTALVGNIDVLSTNFVATANFTERLAKLQEEANKQGLTGPDALLRVLETEQGKRIAAGGDTRTMVQAGRLQQAAAMTMDSGLKTFNAAADINKIASEAFEAAVTKFGKIVGFKEVAGGTPQVSGPAPTVTPQQAAVASEIAKDAAKVSEARTEELAQVYDAVKATEAEIKSLEKSGSSQAEIAKAKEKLADLAKQQVEAEKEERAAAYAARQKALEAKNARQQARRAENAAKITGATPGMTPGGNARDDLLMRQGAAKGTAAGTEKPIASVVSAGPGFTTVATVDGEQQQRKGVRNWRNNNPGNIEYGDFAKSMGAVGSDGRFAVFPTLDAGKKAKEELLFGAKSNYVNLSIREAMARYAPLGENPTLGRYIDSVSAAAGVLPTTRLADLTPSQRQAFLDDIGKYEGFQVGQILPAANGGIIRARPGGTMVRAAEAGLNEAYVPLPDGKNIPVEIANKSPFGGSDQAIRDTLNRLATAIDSLRTDLRTAPGTAGAVLDPASRELLSQLVDLQRRNNTTAERMLQLAGT